MITVSQIMTTELITLSPETEITKAAEILLTNRINGAPVVDEEGQLLGILCQSDLVAQQKNLPVPTIFSLLEGYIQLSPRKIEKQVKKIAALTVAEAMTPDPVSVRPDTGIEAVAALMVDNNFHTLPVVDGDTLVGIVGKEDVLRTLVTPPNE